MTRLLRSLSSTVLATVLVAAGLAAPAAADTPVVRHAQRPLVTDQLIVTFHESALIEPGGTGALRAARVQAAGEQRVARLAARSGMPLSLARTIAERLHVVRLGRAASGAELDRAVALLRADPAVASVEPDGRKRALALPNDPQFAAQWWLQAPAGLALAAINAVGAWDSTTGSERIVVAVVDTGVLFDHPDLQRYASGGKVLPGYDFISAGALGLPAGFVANDGDGRDSDASDPGDGVTAAEKAQYPICADGSASDDASTWHGTHIAGMIGALTNNSAGVAGIGWKTWILPVRVLGKCGGADSDILAGISWAAGLPVSGVADNPTPARIVNLSLGDSGPCGPAYASLAAQLRQRGVSLFAAGGNEGGPVGNPANCPGVIAVGAVRHVGTKVGYSDFGPQIALSAPGGNTAPECDGTDCLILSTANSGQLAPAAMTYARLAGTSFAVPMVAGTAALMLAVNPQLPVDQLRARLTTAARSFPPASASPAQGTPLSCSDPAYRPDAGGNYPNAGECICTTTTCGAGLLDAQAAVAEALRPIAAIALTAPTASAGAPITLDGAPSAAALGVALASYAWTVTPATAALATPAAVQTTLTVPAAGSYTVRLTVTDATGRSDVQTCVVNVSAAGAPAQCGTALPASVPPVIAAVPPPATPVPSPTPAPLPQPVSGGGGGGAVPLLGLALLALAAAVRRRALHG